MYNYKYLIDTSYLIFYTSFSTFNTYAWYQDISKNQFNQELDPTMDQEFCNLLQKRLKANIINPIKQIFPIVDKSNIVFCLDCARKNIWRKQIYPEYKLSRDTNKNPQQQRFNIGKVFQYVYNFIIPKICDEFGSIKVFNQFAEGDDIIAILSKKYIEQNNKVVIVSSDRDMVQLCNDGVDIITINGIKRTPKQQIQSALKQKIKEEVTPGEFLLFKILIGDHSDDIPNVKSGLGPKRAFQLVKNKQKLKSLLKQDRLAAQSFLRNKKLISMNEIPQYISNMVIETVKEKENAQIDQIII